MDGEEGLEPEDLSDQEDDLEEEDQPFRGKEREMVSKVKLLKKKYRRLCAEEKKVWEEKTAEINNRIVSFISKI